VLEMQTFEEQYTLD